MTGPAAATVEVVEQPGSSPGRAGPAEARLCLSRRPGSWPASQERQVALTVRRRPHRERHGSAINCLSRVVSRRDYCGSALSCKYGLSVRCGDADGMVISFESAAAPGAAEEAAAVVDAVLAASQADELDWIEWKSSLDLRDRTVRGILARHILGMANRLPDRAAANAGGRGFVVVGAEPGNRCGVEAADPVDCLRALMSSLAPERPSWTMHYDERDGLPVLVAQAAVFAPPRSPPLRAPLQ
jgi:hypothetical protein